MSLRKLIVLTISVITALGIASTALAGRSDFDLRVAPQNQFVETGQPASVNYTFANNSSSPADCIIEFSGEQNISAPIGVVAPGTTAGGNLVGPTVSKNGRVTAVAICDGVDVDKDSFLVKIR